MRLYRSACRWFILLLLVSVVGFWRSYFSQIFSGELHYSHHLHGITMVVWVSMLILQSWLIRNGRNAHHKKIGRRKRWVGKRAQEQSYPGRAIETLPSTLASSVHLVRHSGVTPLGTLDRRNFVGGLTAVTAGTFLTGCTPEAREGARATPVDASGFVDPDPLQNFYGNGREIAVTTTSKESTDAAVEVLGGPAAPLPATHFEPDRRVVHLACGALRASYELGPGDRVSVDGRHELNVFGRVAPSNARARNAR